ncbi:aminotransferase class IV [Candidatus Pelagibacter sp.]|nr:aminotransferase class IV [Candidatus Pelagibacter sp.]
MAIFLLKKSYQVSNQKEIGFKDLWGSHGVFTTIRLLGKPGKLILFKSHFNGLIESLKKYKIYTKNIEKNIKGLIHLNINKNINYDHLLRVALTKKNLSISIRKRLNVKKNFELKIINYKRIDPVTKNLYYKKILKELNKYDPSKTDIALVYKGKILETCTSNILFFKNREYFSPKNNCYIGNTIKYLKGKIKISFKDIYYKDLKKFDEIMLIGSGKGVTPVKYIKQINWKSKNNFGYKKIIKYLNFKSL